MNSMGSRVAWREFLEERRPDEVASFSCCAESDAVVVGTPVDDALLDGFGFEVLGEGFVDEGGEFGVGGEA